MERELLAVGVARVSTEEQAESGLGLGGDQWCSKAHRKASASGSSDGAS